MTETQPPTLALKTLADRERHECRSHGETTPGEALEQLQAGRILLGPAGQLLSAEEAAALPPADVRVFWPLGRNAAQYLVPFARRVLALPGLGAEQRTAMETLARGVFPVGKAVQDALYNAVFDCEGRADRDALVARAAFEVYRLAEQGTPAHQIPKVWAALTTAEGTTWQKAVDQVLASGGAREIWWDVAVAEPGWPVGEQQRDLEPEGLVTGFSAVTHHEGPVEFHGLPPVAVSTVARPRYDGESGWRIERDYHLPPQR